MNDMIKKVMHGATTAAVGYVLGSITREVIVKPLKKKVKK